MRSKTFRNIGVMFGLATGIGIGIEGVNIDRAFNASADLSATTIGVTAQVEIDRASKNYDDQLLFVIEGAGFTVLMATACVVSVSAGNQVRQLEYAAQLLQHDLVSAPSIM